MNENVCMACLREQTDFDGSDGCPPFQNCLSATEGRCARQNMIARLDIRLPDAHRLIIDLHCLFDHHHCVCAGRDRRTGHHSRRRSRNYFTCGNFTGGYFLDDLQQLARTNNIRGSHSVAVHQRFIVRR